MKTIIALTLALTVMAANAFDFYPAQTGYTCNTLCYGFATSDPAHTVDSVAIQANQYGQLRAGVTVDGVAYQTFPYVADFTTPVLALATDNSGRSIYVTLVYHTRVTGTGRYRKTWFDTTTGTVTP